MSTEDATIKAQQKQALELALGLGTPDCRFAERTTGSGVEQVLLDSSGRPNGYTSGGKAGMRTLIAKIKAAMAAADGNNPEELPPLIAPAAWAGSTQYAYGHVVTLGSPAAMAYNQNESGSQATSGVSAPTLANNGVQDNSTGPYWVPLWNAPAAESDGLDLPAVSWTTVTTGLSQTILNSSNNALPIVRGVGCQLFAMTNYGGVMSYQKYSPGAGLQTTFGGNVGNNVGNNFLSYEFMIDAPKFQIQTLNGDYPGAQFFVGIEVGKRRLKYGNVQPVPATSTLGKNLQLDFSGSGAQGGIGRKIRVYQQSNNGTVAIWAPVTAKIWAPQNPNRYRIFIEGDSLVNPVPAGSNSMAGVDPDLRWTKIFANLVGCDDCFNGGTSASGFVTAGGDGTTYLTRLPTVISLNPDVLIVCGNYNDNSVDHPSVTSAQRRAAVSSYLQQARAGLPYTPILLIGSWPGTYVSSQAAAMQACEADLQYAVNTFGDPISSIFFYSILTDGGVGSGTTNSWLTGGGSVSGTVGDGNGDLWNSSSNPHMTESAQPYAARRYAHAFRSVINAIS